MIEAYNGTEGEMIANYSMNVTKTPEGGLSLY